MIDAIESDWDAGLAEWLAGLFHAPLTSEAIVRYRCGLGTTLLDELEQRPGCLDGVLRMRSALAGEQNVAELTRQLGIAFATLFEGAGGPRTVSPFESAHVSPGGRLFQGPALDMERLLQEVGLATTLGIGEPADHLSIELALLAHLLRATRHQGGAAALLDRHLLIWVPGFVDQLRAADRTGFYAGAGVLLGGFLKAERSMIGGAGEAWIAALPRLSQWERKRS